MHWHRIARDLEPRHPRQDRNCLAKLVMADRETAPKLAAWLQENLPEGLAVFSLSEHHRRRMRTSNPMERGVQQELKRRTVTVRVFPNETRWSGSSAPCWSKQMTNRPPTPKPTSSCSARLRDHRVSESPDNWLIDLWRIVSSTKHARASEFDPGVHNHQMARSR